MGLTQRLDLGEAFDVKTSAVRSSSCPVAREVRKVKPPPPPPPPPPPKAPEKLHSIPSEPLSRSTGFAAEKMRANGSPEGVPTTWLRVVHSGYGSQAWLQDLKDSPLTHVTTARHQEGVYVRPEGSVADLVDQLMAMNLAVRKKTQFKEMKRSNKSRLQFKATVMVFPSARQQAEHDSALQDYAYAESETRASSGDGEAHGYHAQSAKDSGLEEMERRSRQGPVATQYLQSYLAPPAVPGPTYTGYVEDPRPVPRGNPEYWTMPGTYDWEECGNSVAGFEAAVTEATQPMPQMFALQGFPQAQAYQPQFQVPQPVPQGGYYQQQVAQPVYVCMVPAGMHPMQGMQAVQVQ